jgi:hypothetical protein
VSVLKVNDSRLAKPDYPSTCPPARHPFLNWDLRNIPIKFDPRSITHLDSSSVDYFFLAAGRNDQRSGWYYIFEVIEKTHSHSNAIHFTKVLEITLFISDVFNAEVGYQSIGQRLSRERLVQ